VLGYGASNDAYHMAAPDPESVGVAEMMRSALERAGVERERVNYINAHGTSTPLGDAAETKAIKDVFGDHAYRLAMSGTKGYYGHALGASGAIETAICALSLAHGWLPPTINLTQPDPACDLDCLPHEGRTARPGAILTNSFGFGGINATLVLRRA
jgi:3-oxoacyl-[acyl-carrier-protein] synthase II